jgi:hypothetical protein
MDKSRRQLLGYFAAIAACSPARQLLAKNSVTENYGNFRYIYANEAYKKDFYQFLIHVFHLYPEDKLHQLIAEYTQQLSSDREIYIKLQQGLADIKPMLSDLTLAIPALNKQKKVMAKQAYNLLDNAQNYEGYLEIGSTGRYLDSLEEVLNIKGEKFFVSEKPASYSIEDMVDRGQIIKAGETMSLNDYQPDIASEITANSIELATVYIGFHHCPLNLRESFITSIRDAMKPGASLIVRDHDARNDKMQKMVALAHDVFNMGTHQNWNYNEQELRHFYSLETLDNMLTQYGFKSDGRRLFQQGDPTLNALMLYRKV